MTTTTKRPDWAAHLLDVLMEVGIAGTTREGEPARLLRGELLLLDGIAFRVRGRLGESTPRGSDIGELGDELLRAGMAEITAPSRKPARRDVWPALVVATVGTLVFGVLAAVAAAVGQYVQAALWGLIGTAYVVLAATAPRVFGRRQPEPPTGKDGAQ